MKINSAARYSIGATNLSSTIKFYKNSDWFIQFSQDCTVDCFENELWSGSGCMYHHLSGCGAAYGCELLLVSPLLFYFDCSASTIAPGRPAAAGGGKIMTVVVAAYVSASWVVARTGQDRGKWCRGTTERWRRSMKRLRTWRTGPPRFNVTARPAGCQ